jgi:cation diffusion facilitator CzcD-associated flavoprotein CzcO
MGSSPAPTRDETRSAPAEATLQSNPNHAPERTEPVPVSPDVDVLIIGSGFAGLCMAIKLLQAGESSFVLIEKDSDVGGTWRDNTYPGCGCDIPSHLYSFSFDLNEDWTRMYPSQPEIWEYLRTSAAKHGVVPHIRFNTEVREAVFDNRSNAWRVRMNTGEAITARVVVSGMGGLCRPAFPRIPGIERFQGPAFHSAEWDHAVDLRGKRVGVIGTGASAIQFVPRLAEQVARLHLFQRTPPWVLPKLDRPIRGWERFLFRYLPGYMRLFRAWLYWRQEALAIGYTISPKVLKPVEKWARRHIARHIADPALRAKVTPTFSLGCKRTLISNEYYPALARSNVDVITDGVVEVRERSVITADGTERPVDALVFGTGFRTMDLLSPVTFVGRTGVPLDEMWEKEAPEAYYGVAVSGYPNLFFLIGPNSRVANNSIVFMIEAQVHYVLECLNRMRNGGPRTLEVRPEKQEQFNDALRKRLKRTVFVSGCKSWYTDAEGRVPILWPSFSFHYWMRTRKVAWEDFV